MYSCSACGLAFHDRNEFKYHLESHLFSNAERKLCGHFEQIFIPEIKFEKPDINEEKLDNNSTETSKIDLTSVKLEPNVNDNSEKKLHGKFEKSYTFTSKNETGKSKKALSHVSSKTTLYNYEDDSVSTVSKERPIKCSQCIRYFKNMLSLKSHMKVHKFAKNYMCPICKKSFPYDCKLKKHIMRHSASKSHVCKICDKRFVLKKSLVKHMKSHKKDHASAGISCHSFNHKTKLSIKGICGQNRVLKRKEEISQDSPSSSSLNIKSRRNDGYDIDVNNVMKRDISGISLGTNCLKSDDSSGGKLKLQMEINIGVITSPKCLRAEIDDLNVNKKLFGQIKMEALKQEHPGSEVPKEYLAKEVESGKQEKLSNETERQPLEPPRGMCRELDKFEEKTGTCSAENCDEKGVPYLEFINELIIVDELVTDDIYENASDPLL